MRSSAPTKTLGFIGALALPLSATAQSTFNLFAYGTNGGLSAASLSYANGYVVLSNLTSAPDLTSIYFSRDSNATSAWTVHPNTTDPSPPFTAGYVTLTASGASSQISVNDSSADAMALRLFGQTVFGSVDNKLENPFYAAATETEGVWQLVWDPENPDEETFEPVILRSVRPPPRRSN